MYARVAIAAATAAAAAAAAVERRARAGAAGDVGTELLQRGLVGGRRRLRRAAVVVDRDEEVDERLEQRHRAGHLREDTRKRASEYAGVEAWEV